MVFQPWPPCFKAISQSSHRRPHARYNSGRLGPEQRFEMIGHCHVECWKWNAQEMSCKKMQGPGRRPLRVGEWAWNQLNRKGIDAWWQLFLSSVCCVSQDLSLKKTIRSIFKVNQFWRALGRPITSGIQLGHYFSPQPKLKFLMIKVEHYIYTVNQADMLTYPIPNTSRYPALHKVYIVQTISWKVDWSRCKLGFVGLWEFPPFFSPKNDSI